MKNSKIKIAAVAMGAALSVTMLLGGAMLNNSALTASADENDGIMTVSTHVLDAPSFGTPVKYNCMVAYPVIQNDTHCDYVYFKQAANSSEKMFCLSYHANGDTTDNTRYYITHSTSTSDQSKPLYRDAVAYCADCGNYSTVSSMSASNDIAARYQTTNYTAQYKAISTSYTDACTWTFSASANDFCFFSIACNGSVADGAIELIGILQSKTYSVGGVTFTVQANTSKIRIKASSIITADNYNNMFAFYLST